MSHRPEADGVSLGGDGTRLDRDGTRLDGNGTRLDGNGTSLEKTDAASRNFDPKALNARMRRLDVAALTSLIHRFIRLSRQREEALAHPDQNLSPLERKYAECLAAIDAAAPALADRLADLRDHVLRLRPAAYDNRDEKTRHYMARLRSQQLELLWHLADETAIIASVADHCRRLDGMMTAHARALSRSARMLDVMRERFHQRPTIAYRLGGPEPGARRLAASISGIESVEAAQERASLRHGLKSISAQATDTQASDIQASDIQASDTQASDTQASDIQASDIQASDTQASGVKACDIQAPDIQAPAPSGSGVGKNPAFHLFSDSPDDPVSSTLAPCARMHRDIWEELGQRADTLAAGAEDLAQGWKLLHLLIRKGYSFRRRRPMDALLFRHDARRLAFQRFIQRSRAAAEGEAARSADHGAGAGSAMAVTGAGR